MAATTMRLPTPRVEARSPCRRATNGRLSSMTERFFRGIAPSPVAGKSVTHVSPTTCYRSLRTLTKDVSMALKPANALVTPEAAMPCGRVRQKSPFFGLGTFSAR